MWKLRWFLCDFGYAAEWLGDSEIDDKAPVDLWGVVKVSEVMIASLRGHFRSMMYGPRAARSGGPVIGGRVMLTLTQERVDIRLVPGLRIWAGVVIPAFRTALWSPAVAALLGSPSWLRHTV